MMKVWVAAADLGSLVFALVAPSGRRIDRVAGYIHVEDRWAVQRLIAERSTTSFIQPIRRSMLLTVLKAARECRTPKGRPLVGLQAAELPAGGSCVAVKHGTAE